MKKFFLLILINTVIIPIYSVLSNELDCKQTNVLQIIQSDKTDYDAIMRLELEENDYFVVLDCQSFFHNFSIYKRGDDWENTKPHCNEFYLTVPECDAIHKYVTNELDLGNRPAIEVNFKDKSMTLKKTRSTN